MRVSPVQLGTLTCLSFLFAGCGGETSRDSDSSLPTAGITDSNSSGNQETGDDGNDQGSADQGSADQGSADQGDGDPTTGDGDPDPTTTGNGPKWDLGTVPDSNLPCGQLGEGGGGPDFSYIYIANSSQGTMTKLNTETMIEEGRYWVRPDHGGSPSRTSVALSGNVAIEARSSGGGVSKFFADVDNCVESNNMPGIQTSSGANDILAWDVEECRAWHQPFVGKNYWSDRPLAWAPGELNAGTCAWEDEMLWNSGSISGVGTEVLLLNGDTGDIEETIDIPIVGTSYLYGGAVDSEGNFWGLQAGSKIVRVDRQNFTVEHWSLPGGPGYGIAVDAEDRIWTCGGGHASRFDPQTQQWQSTPGATSGIGGCMTDGQGTLYHSRYSQGIIVAIDTETVTPYYEYNIPSYVHGISIDFAGNVWGVTFGGSNAYRLNPQTEVVDTYGGLTGAYTYSDMTGFGLSTVSGHQN